MTTMPNLDNGPDFSSASSGGPANTDAERAILGAILLDNQALAEVEEKLRADDFSLDSHRRIFRRMSGIARTGLQIDIITLANELARHKEIELVGGVAYLASLTEGLPRRPVIEEYIKIVKDKSLARKAIAVCSLGIARAEDQSETGMDVISQIIAELEDCIFHDDRGEDLESVGQWLSQNDVFAERIPGVFTGIDEFDAMTYGLHPGELTVFAGRTSMGKTSFAGTLALNAARRGKHAACFVNEQRKASFIGRMLCGSAGVSYDVYRRGNLDWVEKQYIEDAVKQFKLLPIYIDQRSSMSCPSIRAKSSRLKRNGELDLVLIDQLSRLTGEGIYQKGMRGDEVIGAKISYLKGLAEDLAVPVALFHQLNRGTMKNDGQRPGLENLKNSGEAEEHADNVALFHRPDYYDKSDASLKGKAEIIIAKQRDGDTGVVHCEFAAHCCLWRNRR
jgi:replicative DNA helicase